jgi:hypothetical protein
VHSLVQKFAENCSVCHGILSRKNMFFANKKIGSATLIPHVVFRKNKQQKCFTQYQILLKK